MEILSIWGEFLGGIGVLLSLIFLGVQTRAANRLALASSQREQRHIWQEMMFFIGEHTSEYREFLSNFDDMKYTGSEVRLFTFTILYNFSNFHVFKIEKLLGFGRFIFTIFKNENINSVSVTYPISNRAYSQNPLVQVLYRFICSKLTSQGLQCTNLQIICIRHSVILARVLSNSTS